MSGVTQTYWYHFNQNNSGGRFDIDQDRGIGPHVWIEAVNAGHANYIARDLGIYFDGVDDGIDCKCCGDRWHWASDSGPNRGHAPLIHRERSFSWYPYTYLHPLSGGVISVSKDQQDLPAPFKFREGY